jgi:DNA repair exonuclease SbcCD ATPase subunit
MNDLIEKFQALRDRYNFRRGQKEQLDQRRATLMVDQAKVVEEQRICKESVLLLEFAGQGAREMIVSRFKDIVTFALQSVFGEDYAFTVETDIKRNQVCAEFRVVSSEYVEPADPMLSRGGGVVDIVALALRAVLLELYTPRIDGPLMLDEPTAHLSAEFSSHAAELLTAISERTGRQIILVTHDSTLAKEAGKRFDL